MLSRFLLFKCDEFPFSQPRVSFQVWDGNRVRGSFRFSFCYHLWGGAWEKGKKGLSPKLNDLFTTAIHPYKALTTGLRRESFMMIMGNFPGFFFFKWFLPRSDSGYFHFFSLPESAFDHFFHFTSSDSWIIIVGAGLCSYTVLSRASVYGKLELNVERVRRVWRERARCSSGLSGRSGPDPGRVLGFSVGGLASLLVLCGLISLIISLREAKDGSFFFFSASRLFASSFPLFFFLRLVI